MTNAARQKHWVWNRDWTYSRTQEVQHTKEEGFTSILHLLLVMPILDGWEVRNGISDCHSPQRGTNALWDSCELHMAHHASGRDLFANMLHRHSNTTNGSGT